jgi:tyrosyl-tRNA synthetase
VILLPLLEGLDGVEKMSKSKNNYIGVNENPSEMYGKTMSIPDELISEYFNLVTDLPVYQKNQIKEDLLQGKLHPRDAKMFLAKTIVRIYHNVQEAEKAEAIFKTVFQRGWLPDDIPVVKWQGEKLVSIVELLTELKLQKSRTEARKMILNDGIRHNEIKVTDINLQIDVSDDPVIQVGKRRFIKIETK